MTVQDNALLAQKVYQYFNENQYDCLAEAATEDIEVVIYPFNQTLRGPDGFAAFIQGFKTAFPDMTIHIDNQVVSGDQVVSEFTARGKHSGPLTTPAGEVPATGKEVALKVCEVWRIRDGKVASLHNYQDAASLMRQLGLAA